MKVDLSINKEDYKKRIKLLRKKLDKCKETGVLEDGLEEEIKELIKIEKTLLKELIPYYRICQDSAKKTSMEVKLIKELGAFSFDNIPQNILRVSKDLFLVSGINSKVQFFYIDTLNNSYNCDQIEVEWSPEVKEISERVSFMHKLNDHEILLLGMKGGGYLISSNDFNRLPDIAGYINIKKIKVAHDSDKFRGYGNVMEVEENLFLVNDINNRLTLFELRKDKGEYSIVFSRETYFTLPDLSSMKKIGENNFVFGTKNGEMYLMEYDKYQFTIIDKIDVFQEKIRKIEILEDETKGINSLMVVGNNGHLKIFSLEKDIILEKNDLRGNLFNLQSEEGTAIVLSEDGIVYLFEKNFENWSLNEKASIQGKFFIHASRLDNFRYLLLDISGKVYILSIKGVYTSEDLWEVPFH